MRGLWAVAGISVLLVSGCSPAGPGGETGSLAEIEGDWQLSAGSDAAGAIELGTASVTLRIDGDAVSGTSACNQYFGSISGSPQSLLIGELGQTEMACLDGNLMEIESRYLGALATVTKATLGSGVGLILTGPAASLTFLPVEEVPVAELTGTRWLLEGLIEGLGDDGSVSSVTGDAWVQFTADGTLEGHSGCRAFAGKYVTAVGQAMTTELVADDEVCTGALQLQDDFVFAVLGRFSVTIDGNRLTLTAPIEGRGLSFRAG